MQNAHEDRYPFLDDPAAGAELVGSVLRAPVVGRDNIRLVIDAVGPSRLADADSEDDGTASFSNTRPS